MKLSVSRLTRTNVRNPNLSKEKAMKKSFSILATILVATLATPALAQQPAASASVTASAETDAKPATAAPADDAKAAAPATAGVFAVNTMSEAMALNEESINYLAQSTIELWAKGVKGQIHYFVDERVKAPATNKDLKGDLETIPTGAVDQASLLGKDPTEHPLIEAYLVKKDCKETGEQELAPGVKVKTYSPGCHTAAKELDELVKKALATSKASAAVKANAEYLLGQAMGDGTDGPGGGLKGPLKIAALIRASLALPFTEWEKAYGLTNDLGSALVGKDGAFLYADGTMHQGKIEKVDPTGITVDGKTEPYSAIEDGSVALLVGDPSLFDSLSSLKGKQGCFEQNGEEVCLTILEATRDGVKLDGQSIDLSQLSGLSTWATGHPVSIEARFVLRRGWADQYDGSGMTGGLLVGRLNVHENLGIHLGIGVLGLSGQPTLGTEEQDSQTLFAAMMGVRALLGSRSWPVAPMLEANATFQGSRPGVEGMLGVQTAEGLRESFPVDISAGLSLGYYPTGSQPFVHPYKATEDFNLFGVGAVLTAGYTF